MTPLEFILIPLITRVPTSLSVSRELLSSMWSESAPQISPRRPSYCGLAFLIFAEASVDRISRQACCAWLFLLGHSTLLCFFPSSSCLSCQLCPVSPLPSACLLLTVHAFQITAGIGGKATLCPPKLSVLLPPAVSAVPPFSRRCLDLLYTIHPSFPLPFLLC